jgi:ubiquinone/menaquinone biosynthesis C-methylase UbiE
VTLPRVLEPEVMDTPEEALAYDRMDHAGVNRRFVDDFLAAGPGPGDVLDLGTGTAQIPIELCRRWSGEVTGVDLAASMLDLARANVELANLSRRIRLERVDGKSLPYSDGRFGNVMSNSIVHHIPEPSAALREAVRVVRPGGLIFFRDLFRPGSREALDRLVATYAGDADACQQGLFAASLHAALTINEVRELVAALGFPPESATETSDRHWTWIARKA